MFGWPRGSPVGYLRFFNLFRRFGSVLYAVGCFLANDNIQYLWLASLGMVVNWYGDSLDGTLARVRELQRPIYGFFIDHTLDAGTISIMCIGAGLSPMFRFDIALLVLAGYLVLSVYTYICAIVKEEEPEILEQTYDMDCLMRLRIRKSAMPRMRARLEKVETLRFPEPV